jgi:hypothetical protein
LVAGSSHFNLIAGLGSGGQEDARGPRDTTGARAIALRTLAGIAVVMSYLKNPLRSELIIKGGHWAYLEARLTDAAAKGELAARANWRYQQLLELVSLQAREPSPR